MFKTFESTDFGQKFSHDCLKIISYYYYKNKFCCSFCKTTDIDYYDYHDGIGFICSLCYHF